MPRQRLDEARVLCRVVEYFPQARNRGVQVVVEIDEDVVRPEPLPQVLARDHFPRTLQQQRQHSERLLLQWHPHSGLAQLRTG